LLSVKTMITLEQVKHLADLAHMELSETELKKLQKEMEQILDYISQLEEVDVSGIEPVAGGHELENVVREKDAAVSFGFDENMLLQFPEKQGDYNKVPKIIEK